MLAATPTRNLLSSFFPVGTTPTFIQPAHGGDNFYRPNAPDVSREQLLPALPSVESAHDPAAWAAWENWQLVVALLPERDTVNGEYFDLKDILPCLASCSGKRFSAHVQKLYPDWSGRYHFHLVHVLRVIKRYQRDGWKKHSRADLIERVRVKAFDSAKPE